jgi:hypothetical protein
LLLTSALIAVVEALRMNPDRYAVIYDSKDDDNDTVSDSNGTTAVISLPPKSNENYNYNEYHEGILEIANSLLKILSRQTVDKTMAALKKL